MTTRYVRHDFNELSTAKNETVSNFLDSSWGIPCELVTPKRCQEIWPMLNVDDILGGLWIPGDGVGDPRLFCMSLMREAIENGKIRV